MSSSIPSLSQPSASASRQYIPNSWACDTLYFLLRLPKGLMQHPLNPRWLSKKPALKSVKPLRPCDRPAVPHLLFPLASKASTFSYFGLKSYEYYLNLINPKPLAIWSPMFFPFPSRPGSLQLRPLELLARIQAAKAGCRIDTKKPA